MPAIDYQQEYNKHKTLFELYDRWLRSYQRFIEGQFPDREKECGSIDPLTVLKCHILSTACRDHSNCLQQEYPGLSYETSPQLRYAMTMVICYDWEFPRKMHLLYSMRPLPGDSYEWLNFLNSMTEKQITAQIPVSSS